MIPQCAPPTDNDGSPFHIIDETWIDGDCISVYASDNGGATVSAVVPWRLSTAGDTDDALLASWAARAQALADRCAALVSYQNEEPTTDEMDD